MRINKYLASLGVASRRKVDELIEDRKVTVNGKPAKLGDDINPKKDKVKVDSREVQTKQELIYLALNKPKGYTSTTVKIKGEKSILELVSAHPRGVSGSGSAHPGGEDIHGTNNLPRIYPVGRLDRDSSGLIFLTNDGEFANRLTHPKYHVPKKYEIKILGNVPDEKIQMLSSGVELEDGKTKPAEVKIVKKSLPHDSTLEITLYEGKKRQIRRMMAALHLHIIDLKRTSIGPVKLAGLSMGKYRKLSKEEVSALSK